LQSVKVLISRVRGTPNTYPSAQNAEFVSVWTKELMVKRKKTQNIDAALIKKAARLLKDEQLTAEQHSAYKLHAQRRIHFKRLKIHIDNRNEQWSIDLADLKQLLGYNDQYRYLLVCIDIATRYAFVKPLKNKTASNVRKKFEEILSEAGGAPKKIQADEGTEFNQIKKDLSKKYGFTLFHTQNCETKAVHAERFIRTFKQMITRSLTTLNMGYRYIKYLPTIVERYNEAPHRGKGRKALVVGALPTINLPERSHQAKLAPARRPLTIVNQNAQNTTEKDCYKNFKELCERTKKLKLPEWQQECTSEKLVLKLFVSPLLIPKFEIIIEENFHFTCVVYGWVLASNHSVYGGNKRSLKNITVSELLQKLTHYCLCHGISEQTAGSVHHAIPCRTFCHCRLMKYHRTKAM
ncbi:uncharacterized transposon-derived, partial [Paramuricea clavata]